VLKETAIPPLSVLLDDLEMRGSGTAIGKDRVGMLRRAGGQSAKDNRDILIMQIISILQALLTPVSKPASRSTSPTGNGRQPSEAEKGKLRTVPKGVPRSREMLQRVNRDFAPEWDELLLFNAATAEAPFLFQSRDSGPIIDENFSSAGTRCGLRTSSTGEEQRPHHETPTP